MARAAPGFRQMWGFDSFQGLPQEAAGVDIGHKSFEAGGWSAADALRTYDLDKLVARVKRRIDHPNVTLVPGFFSKSLRSLDLAALRPPGLVDVDVDIYISTFQALDWLFGSRLGCPGLLMRYDDWQDNYISPESKLVKQGFKAGSYRDIGEMKAHHEISKRHGLEWRRIHGGRANEFELVSLRAPHASCDTAS